MCVAAGPGLTAWLGHAAGWQVPTFLVVLLAAVALTNGADLLRRPFDTQASDLVGTVALRVFLAMAMLTLDWAELAEHLPLLLSGALVQAAITCAIGIWAMPIGLAVMRRLQTAYGDAPRAMLAFTLAASLFPETANALVIATLLRWLGAGG